MNLIIGSTGMLGCEISHLLAKENMSVRAFVRETSDPMKVKCLQDLGCEIAKGDLRKSSSVRRALQDVSTVIFTASSMPLAYESGENDPVLTDRNATKNLIDEARIAGVKRFIYTSISGNIDIEFPLRNAKRDVETHLRRSGMVYTILRPSFFMETWLTPAVGFDVENAKVQLCGHGKQRVSYISYKDVAKFAVKSLSNLTARNATLELGGPEKLSQVGVVHLFHEITGRKFEVQHISVEDLKAQLESSTDLMQKSFSGLMLCLAKGDIIEMRELQEKFSIQLTSVRQYAKSMEHVS